MQPESNISIWLPLEQAFRNARQEIYLVGGYVRNRLLGLPATDIDLGGTATPDEAVEICRNAGFDASIRSCELGTVDVRLSDQQAEYTPFRIDSYATGGAHRPQSVRFTRDIVLDARRRDFTVNALYQRIRSGDILDPLSGLPDLESKRLRACGITAAETLADDGLRILRMARFCAELGFWPDDELLLAAKENAQNLLALSSSRIFGEWQRLCVCDLKYPDFSNDVDKPWRAMELLDRSGALSVLLPSLGEGIGVAQNPRFHRYDVYFHCLHSFAAAKPDVVLRTAALLHDVGKPLAKSHSGHMHGHEEAGETLARPILDVLGVPARMQREILLLIHRHMFDLNGKAKESTVRIRFANWGFLFAEKLIDLRRADIAGSGVDSQDETAHRWETILTNMRNEGTIDDIDLLAVDGNDIAAVCNLTPGKRIGRIKQLLFDRCAVRPGLNCRKSLLSMAVSLNRQLPNDQ